MEKGYPKTSSLPPTMAVTDNTLLSGMGGQWSHRRAGRGQGQRALDKGPHSRIPPPPLPWAPHKVPVFVPAPGLGGTGHLCSGSSSAHHFATTLLCRQHLSESFVFLPAKSSKFLPQIFSSAPAPPPTSTLRAELAHYILRQVPRQGKARSARPARDIGAARGPQAISSAALEYSSPPSSTLASPLPQICTRLPRKQLRKRGVSFA